MAFNWPSGEDKSMLEEDGARRLAALVRYRLWLYLAFTRIDDSVYKQHSH